MITINTISPTRFSFNGVTYHKNFMPFVTGNKIAIINVYDGCITLTDAPTIFSDFTVNGVTYSSVNDLQSALLDVIYTRNSLTNAAITLTTTGNSGAATLTGITLNIPNYIGGTGTTNYLPKFTGGSTLGNSNLINDANGNLGLGVTPSAWSSTSKVLEFSSGAIESRGSVMGMWANAYFNGTSPIYKTTAAASNYYQLSGEHLWLTAPSGTAGNAISFTQAMTLDASGRLGIGTTSPSEKLDVNGNLKLNSSSPYISLNSTYWGNPAYIQSGINLGGNAAGDYLAFQNLAGKGMAFQRGSTTDLLISTTGNVGIGTTSPTDKLQVNGGKSIFASSNFNGTNTGGAVFVFSDDNNGGKIWAQKDGNQSWGYLALQPSGGNVLIGTTTDAGYKLDVNGTGRFSDTLSIANGEAGQAIFTNNSTAVSVSTATALGGSFSMGGSGAFVIVYGADGSNVFIDTIIAANSGTPTVLSSTTVSGTPSLRTYSTGSNRLQLAMASGTYSVRINILRQT